jgi:transposase-like protein
VTEPNTMVQARRGDSARRHHRVQTAISDTIRSGEEISVSGIARRARVDRSFLYRHRDLLTQIHAAQAQPPPVAGHGPTVSRASLLADLANTQERNRRLHARVRQLEKALSELLGEQAWRESGLGAPEDIDHLKHRITTLEQHIVELTGQLDQRNEELHAARAANRELMTQLNTRTPQPSGQVPDNIA